ncbi:MAG: FG-GAP repeat protein [Nitrososphaerales archaeon]
MRHPDGKLAGHLIAKASSGTPLFPIIMTSPNVQTNGNFGVSVAISGTTIVVGAPFETVSGLSAAGHAYVM